LYFPVLFQTETFEILVSCFPSTWCYKTFHFQTTIAVTILHKIHYSIEVPKNKNGLLVFKI
jgi:hypothetical protein